MSIFQITFAAFNWEIELNNFILFCNDKQTVTDGVHAYGLLTVHTRLYLERERERERNVPQIYCLIYVRITAAYKLSNDLNFQTFKMHFVIHWP